MAKATKPIKKAPEPRIIPVQMQRIRQDAATRKSAIAETELAYFPHRVKLQQMYLNTIENLHVAACIERRKDLTLLRNIEFKNASGTVDEELTKLFCKINVDGKTTMKPWFANYISQVLDAQYFGYSLIFLGDIVNNEFPNIESIRRWNVSPDRLTLVPYTYLIHGIQFMDDTEFKDYFVYVPTPNQIGTSKCGYGLLYQVSMAEIFLRNLLGYNGDFVELFAQPFRVGKTNKTQTSEREAFQNILANMGSSGWAMIDENGESIDFLETSLGGTGWQGYDNFEQRLQAAITRFILGHSDAISSIPGKLGNSNEKSPAEIALDDKATKDENFLLPFINDELFERMRALGFNIPEGSTASFQNNKESIEIARTWALLAKDIKAGGFQMDADDFSKRTGIKLSEVVMPDVNPNPKSITNKLRKYYEVHGRANK